MPHSFIFNCAVIHFLINRQFNRKNYLGKLLLCAGGLRDAGGTWESHREDNCRNHFLLKEKVCFRHVME